ncbi:L-ribulose-5-phosphate 4-epimerase AraD [bacterium]|nr:L-ribulose-5-phosphate 4-epimerase AraD [bacterium]
MASFKELKQQVFEANLELRDRGVVLYTFGNVSAADRDAGIIAIKPSGVPYEDLKASDMVIVDLENRIVEGSLRPSSDTKTHLVLYRAFPEIGGVAHTHSTWATAWAQACRPVPILGTTHADAVPGEIPCTAIMTDARISGDYEEETGNQILEAFKERSYRDTEMVLVAGHGPFTWGADAAAAVKNAVMLEELCKTALLTLRIDPEAKPLKQTLIDRHYRRKHGKEAYYGQEK